MEKLMQYVWQHRLWSPSGMVTVDGRRVEVIDQGLLNTDAGPDFFNAKVSIGGDMWVGNVEIHVRASDWHRHHHDDDPAYDTVVLHVVATDDARIRRSNGETIPQVVMPCAANFSERYNAMVNNPLSELPCGDEIPDLPSVYITDWLTSLAYERLYRKTDRILDLLDRLDGNWMAAVYVTVARALGFSTNSEAFERLALSVPIKTLLKHRSSPEAVEGLLFGQAGFLDSQPDTDPYVVRMKQEYAFMCNKFNITRPESLGWKMARMRPQNFPHRRIATLAAMACEGFSIGSNIFEVCTVDDAARLFDIELQGFWARRYNFGAPSATSAKAFSSTSVNTLIINVVVPLLYAHGQAFGDKVRMERAADIMQNLRPEANSIVGLFTAAGIPCRDAMTSQALIELRNEYCNARKCLYCRIGHRLLAQKVQP
jgi:hypothetical protein